MVRPEACLAQGGHVLFDFLMARAAPRVASLMEALCSEAHSQRRMIAVMEKVLSLSALVVCLYGEALVLVEQIGFHS